MSDERWVKDYLPKVSKPIATNVVVTEPAWDGSFPGWGMNFTVPKGSPKTLGQIVDEAHRLLPNGQVDNVSIRPGGKVTMKVIADRDRIKPPGLDTFRHWLVSYL